MIALVCIQRCRRDPLFRPNMLFHICWDCQKSNLSVDPHCQRRRSRLLPSITPQKEKFRRHRQDSYSKGCSHGMLHQFPERQGSWVDQHVRWRVRAAGMPASDADYPLIWSYNAEHLLLSLVASLRDGWGEMRRAPSQAKQQERGRRKCTTELAFVGEGSLWEGTESSALCVILWRAGLFGSCQGGRGGFRRGHGQGSEPASGRSRRTTGCCQCCSFCCKIC